MSAFVALLRAVNLGGGTTIRMPALKMLFESLGLAPAKTHLASGNVVFAAKETDHTKLATTIGNAVAKAFGFRPAIVIRSRAELRRIIERNPFPQMAESDPSHLLVMCLAAKPKADAAAKLAEAYSGPEAIRILGANVYLTYPDGIGRSKLTNAVLEKHLGTIGTARNWNTMTKLLTLAGTIEAG